jgi:hypothetical protein
MMYLLQFSSELTQVLFRGSLLLKGRTFPLRWLLSQVRSVSRARLVDFHFSLLTITSTLFLCQIKDPNFHFRFRFTLFLLSFRLQTLDFSVTQS